MLLDIKTKWPSSLLRTITMSALLAVGAGGAMGSAACSEDAQFGGVAAGGQGPFARFCGDRAWQETLSPAVLGQGEGDYVGFIDQALKIDNETQTCVLDDADLTESVEGVRLIPKHPFMLHSLRVAFAGTSGAARLRLRPAYGRSYPGPCAYYEGGTCPDLSDTSLDVIPPQEFAVTDPDPNVWIEIDVSSYGVVLEPTQHYFLVFEHLDDNLRLPLLTVPPSMEGMSTYFRPIENVACGLGPNGYALQVTGDNVCAWQDEDHWFGRSPQPFSKDEAGHAVFVDLDGDGHDDLVTTSDRPAAYFGDGKGHFTPGGANLFPDLPTPVFLAFGDLDNDGDQDAFFAVDAGHDQDQDGDGYSRLQGDCNDLPAADDPDADEVYPGAVEVANQRDDDCDGIADDGSATEDLDGDGFSIADGDCDDTRKDVHPGADEILDRFDNDCNGRADEIFVNRILLNDGSGKFSILAGSGVEVLDHSYAASFGDGNSDGNLDIFWGNWLLTSPYHAAAADRYFEGNGDGSFHDAFAAAGLDLKTPYSCYGVMWNDYNDDGLQDIFVGNYHMYPNQMWQNQGNGSFVDVSEKVGVHFDAIPPPPSVSLPGGHTYGGDFGDIDNDGDMDFFMANLAHPRVRNWSDTSMLYMNQGPPDFQFVDQREPSGIIYDEGDLNASFADFDNDGDLDVVGGGAYPQHYSRLYRNEGGGADGVVVFTDVTYETGTAIVNGAHQLWSDVDRDGDLDLLILGGPSPDRVNLFINRIGQERNWVQLELQGSGSNRGGVGARVRLSAGGINQMRDVSGPGGHKNNQQSRFVHFGLNDATTIDSLEVRWIGGTTETISGAAAGGRYLIVEGSGSAVPLP